MVYDSRVQRVIYMTDSGAGWAWDGNDWSRAWQSADVPQPVGDSRFLDSTNLSLGYDEDHQMVIVLSARLVTDVVASNITQTESFVTSGWDGSKWQQLARTKGDSHGDNGPDWQFGRMAFDRDRHQMVAMGIHSTWTWDGAAWAAHGKGSSEFKTSSGGGVGIYDPARHRMLWFDGSLDGKHAYPTRLANVWTGNAWTELPSKNAPFDDFPSIAFDESHGLVVMVGGQSDA